ncbi:MAG: C45 family autoproteolytic acyltransferase/hydrolase [Armatimonadota bacterium]
MLHAHTRRLRLVAWRGPAVHAAVLLLAACSAPAARAASAPYPDGHLGYLDGYMVLHVAGTPEQMGEQHGRLLRAQVRRMVQNVVHDSVAISPQSYRRLIDGTLVMERFQPVEYRRELRALARAADVNYYDLVLAQLFGDVQRGMSYSSYSYCTSYGVFGPATKTGECIVGRNMDFYDYGVPEYGMVIAHFTPDRGRPFMTITWAGIINGWTLMNADGIVTANNTAYGAHSNSLEGISTCFMLRKAAQYARTVAQGVEIVKATPRAVGTNMLIAGGTPPAAAIVEFDHEKVEARWANDGVVLAANEFRRLYRDEPGDDESWGHEPGDDEDWADDDGGTYSSYYPTSRYGILEDLIRENYGAIDRTMNFAAADGVPLQYMNLQCVLLFPGDLSFNAGIGMPPACDRWFRRLRMTERGIVKAD